MRTSWLIVLALLVAGLATLFATTMTRLAGLHADAQTMVVTVPAAAAAPQPAPALAQPQPAPQPLNQAASTSTEPSPPATEARPTAPQQAPSQTGPSKEVNTLIGAPAAAPPVQAAPAPRPLNLPPALPADARPTPARANPPPAPTAQNTSREAPREPRSAPSATTRTSAVTAVDARNVRCRALSDYQRDLDLEAARAPAPGRQAWLVEQRNTVRERQSELGC
jgi:outer membrane biosynthesis protein TonB